MPATTKTCSVIEKLEIIKKKIYTTTKNVV